MHSPQWQCSSRAAGRHCDSLIIWCCLVQHTLIRRSALASREILSNPCMGRHCDAHHDALSIISTRLLPLARCFLFTIFFRTSALVNSLFFSLQLVFKLSQCILLLFVRWRLTACSESNDNKPDTVPWRRAGVEMVQSHRSHHAVLPSLVSLGTLPSDVHMNKLFPNNESWRISLRNDGARSTWSISIIENASPCRFARAVRPTR